MDVITLTRILPALLVVGGGAAAANGGATVGADLMDTVKVVMVRYELASAVKLLEADFVLSGSLPGSSSPEALSIYLRENMKATFGRDSGLDMWNGPYRLRRVGGGIAMVSYGPNGQRDECAEANVNIEMKSLAHKIDVSRAKELGQELDGEEAPEPPKDDDICAMIALGSNASDSGDISNITDRDSPFKPIPQ